MGISERLSKAKGELEKHRGRDDIKLGELVQIANDIIDLVVPWQPSGRVREILTERNLRYYIAEDLIEPPWGKGTAARYGYRHILQALIVKALQGAYLPLKRIKEILGGKSDLELEGILACQTMESPNPLELIVPDSQGRDISSAKEKALDYLVASRGFSKPSVDHEMINCHEPQAENSLNVDFFRYPTPVKPDKHTELSTSEAWERFRLADGIELHVRTDRLQGLSSSEIKRSLERLLNLLKNRT